jgi:hypothetical protein
VRGGDDRIADDRHERRAVDRPRVDDRLARLALALAQDGVDRPRDAREDGLDVGVDSAVSCSRSRRRKGRTRSTALGTSGRGASWR